MRQPTPFGQLAGDRKPIELQFLPYNLFREPFHVWAQKKREALEQLIDKERAIYQKELDQYGLKEYNKRSGKSDHPNIEFEWLALSVCKAQTDAQIALAYRLPQNTGKDRVKKARRALLELGFRIEGK